jgi:hypothetical protein
LGWCQGIGIGTGTPHSSAQLEVYDSVRGFLPPRLALNAANLPNPVSSPATGLLVYNTATTGTGVNSLKPGYYFWNGSRWTFLNVPGQATGDMLYWNGTQWVILPIGPNNSVLTVCGGLPTWGPCPQSTLTISPANNPYEGLIIDYYPTSFVNPHPQVLIEAWTNGGAPFTVRSMLKFDYSGLPNNAVIDSAWLYLYADPAPLNGNLTHAMFGTSNACIIERITSNWPLPTPFSWSTPPQTTAVNQAIIPQSNSAFENSVVNVTNLVKDMVQYGNNGFYIRLINEVTYNSRQYLSSTYADLTKRPRLVIKYH